jgi:2-polyprenyl-6-methoxyphenol hydroxylase-like FAD-dependent oxidoreductase
MCAARVLADFFERVTVVERDAYPAGVADRAGVPQGRHFHYLLRRGCDEVEALFPGFEAMLRECGAPDREIGVNSAVMGAQGWVAPRREFRMPAIQASRALIESSVREIFLKIPRVEVLERTEVTALTADRSNGTGAVRCTGVEIRSRNGKGVGKIAADLVVDASGGNSRADLWLKNIGVAPPTETIIDGKWGYSSRWYRMTDGSEWPSDWWWNVGVAVLAKPPEHLSNVMLVRYERGRWSLALSGLGGHYPPDDELGLRAMLPAMRSPVIARMLQLMEPTSPFYTSRATRNRWRHYERWSERVHGFVAIGDAAVVYNPTAGQGMSVVAVTSQVLRECIAAGRDGRDGMDDLAPRFFAAQAAAQLDPWRLAVGIDVRLPTTVGERPLSVRMLNWYRDLIETASSDRVVRDRMTGVLQMLRPISSLFQADILRRVATVNLRRALRRTSRDATEASMPPPMPD